MVHLPYLTGDEWTLVAALVGISALVLFTDLSLTTSVPAGFFGGPRFAGFLPRANG